MTPDACPRSEPDTISSANGHVLLVGCGAIGTVIAGHLAAHPSLRRLTLADVDERFAQGVAQRLPDRSRIATRSLDAGDPASLESALKDVQVVVQASVPRFNAAIQAACLANGANYIDLAADSSDPYVASPEWARRGLVAVIGMGEDPGLSNVMARYSADRLERVRAIRVRDGDTASSPDHAFLPLFSPETFIEETLHTSRIWDGGRYREVPPFGEGEVYDFPSPVGPQKVYSVDHEEVDSLPRFIGKGVEYVDFKLALDDNTVRTLQTLRDLKLLERGTPDAPGPRRAVLAALPKPVELAGKIDGHAALVVETTGEKSGKASVETLYTLLDHRRAAELYHATATAYLTGTPAAVAVLQMLSGQVGTPGMHPPEALDPKPFFPMLKERGVSVLSRRTSVDEIAS
jgi:saccharopine dehydrogenase (NAD+, L-lysine forming)